MIFLGIYEYVWLACDEECYVDQNIGIVCGSRLFSGGGGVGGLCPHMVIIIFGEHKITPFYVFLKFFAMHCKRHQQMQ